MSDKELIDIITDNGRLKYVSKRYIEKIKNNNINIYNEIINRYNDSDSIKETLYRLKNNIEMRPVCKYCKGHIKFINDKGERHWQEYCSQECLHNDQEHWNKCKQSTLNNHGDKNYRNIEKSKQTKLERYGDENYININSSRETRFKKYNQWHSPKNIEVSKNKTEEEKKLQVLKSKQTKLERYGDENYVNIEKAKQTKLERYGDENYHNIDLMIIHTDYKARQEKIKATCLEKYGVECVLQSEEIKNKIKNTCLEKYGVDSFFKSEIFNKNRPKHSDESYQKAIKTSLKKFGRENFNNREKAKQTCLKKYGVTNKRKLQESRDHMSVIMSSKEVQNKRNNTLKKNNTFNKSKSEEISYILLKEKYPDIIRQYKSDLYPFACDFYIPSLDLYIECNYHWTHGYHFFDKNNIKDINKLELWKSKNTAFYNKAIYVWTIKDIEKQKIAKENNLNYLVFWNINELKNYINK